MTSIELGKSLTRKTAATVQRRPLVVKLHAGYLELRRAGTRTPFAISYEAVYIEAARLAANKARAAKREANKAKAAR